MSEDYPDPFPDPPADPEDLADRIVIAITEQTHQLVGLLEEVRYAAWAIAVLLLVIAWRLG